MENNTKKILAEGLKELMKKKPYEKITVVDIVNYCKVNRGTFYLHFYDKYDLVKWILKNEVLDIVISQTLSSDDYLASQLLCTLLYQHKSFYSQVIRHDIQDYIKNYLRAFSYKQAEIVMIMYDQTKYLDQQQKDFICRFYFNAFFGLLMDWITSGMTQEPKIIASQWYSMVEKTMYPAICNISHQQNHESVD